MVASGGYKTVPKMQAFAQVLAQLRRRPVRMRWWEMAVATLYLLFAAQEVKQGSSAAALAAAGISATFVLMPFAVFKTLSLRTQVGLVLLAVGLMVMSLNLSRSSS